MTYSREELIKVIENMDDKSIGDMSIEEKMDILDDLIESMESGESTLAQTFDLYEKGMKLVASCNDAIDRVEKEVLKLNDDGSTEGFPDME